jgi:hypothetical protein
MEKWFDWQAEYLLHELRVAFALKPALCGLSPEDFVTAVGRQVQSYDFFVPMTLTYRGVTFTTPAHGSAGWMLFHRWRFVANIVVQGGACTVDGRLRLRALDRVMSLFVANVWIVMLVPILFLVLEATFAEGRYEALLMLLMVPVLFLWMRFVTSMLVPQRRRGEAGVRGLLATP